VIDELGAGVTAWTKGQRVGVGYHGGQDNTCLECRRGRFLYCRIPQFAGFSYDGGYQQHMVAPVEALAAIGDPNMNKTRLSLLYLGSYLVLIGLCLLFAPQGTLRLLQSNGDYGDVFPRVAGMLMSGLGFSVFGIIRVGAAELYPATIFIRIYFLICLTVFYRMTSDPLFLVLIVIVGIGLVVTLSFHLLDRRTSADAPTKEPPHSGAAV
jgi:hypothetical protein